MPSEFLDTNVLVYAFTTDPRAVAAQALLGRRCVISVQALNEFANVARRKLGMTWREVRDALAAISIVCRTILPVDIETHADALRVAERHGYTMFDALMIAAALRARCTVLYSEDMQDGMTIGGRLRIVDPFRDLYPSTPGHSPG
jgi:predicted nucleic acid-binding protein